MKKFISVSVFSLLFILLSSCVSKAQEGMNENEEEIECNSLYIHAIGYTERYAYDKNEDHLRKAILCADSIPCDNFKGLAFGIKFYSYLNLKEFDHCRELIECQTDTFFRYPFEKEMFLQLLAAKIHEVDGDALKMNESYDKAGALVISYVKEQGKESQEALLNYRAILEYKGL